MFIIINIIVRENINSETYYVVVINTVMDIIYKVINIQ